MGPISENPLACLNWIVEEAQYLGLQLKNITIKTIPESCQALSKKISQEWNSVFSFEHLQAKTVSLNQTIVPSITLCDTIADAWETFITCISTHSYGETIQLTGKKIMEHSTAFCASVPDYMQLLSAKMQYAWIEMKPYIHATIIFLQSNLGISLTLLTGGIACFKISQNIESRIASIAFFTFGLGTTIVGGMYLMNTGLIPTLPQGAALFPIQI